jgi:uncharacterized protein (DUF1697 family)
VARLVALLRGINLGRTRRVPMAELREMLEEMGYADVRTLLQSGNAVFTADEPPDDVARAIEAKIAKRFGFDVDVVVRTADELAAVVAASPLPDIATDGARYVVVFLPAEPDRAALAALAERDFAPERFEARGREVYAWCPNGLQKSPVIAALMDRLGSGTGTATVRNWNTVTKLAAMAGEDA